MENTLFRSNEPYVFEFPTLRDFVEYIDRKLSETDFMKARFKFTADVVKVKPYNGSLYVTVSQETTDGKKTELTVIIWKNITQVILKTLGLKTPYELEHKKWEFQGRLSFYPDRSQFSFWADSVASQGESDILQRRQKIKELLKKEGLFTEAIHNLSELEPIKRIAVISSKTAQGYFDFLSNILVPNHMRPVIHLYESTMQGATTAEEVIKSLDKIDFFCKKLMIKYDVIVIIRGGGGPSDLMYFDDYSLAQRIAQMNNFIPVLTGIGHEKDETIPDFVAWKRFPTPTAVAKEISNQLKNYLDVTERSYREIKQIIHSKFQVITTLLSSDNKNVLEKAFKNGIIKIHSELKSSGRALYELFSLREYEKLISQAFVESLSNSLEFQISNSINSFGQNQAMLARTFEIDIQSKNQQIENLQKLSETLEKRYINTLNEIEEYREELTKLGGAFVALLYGGAVITRSGTLIQRKEELKQDDEISVNFLDGKVKAKIEEI